MWQSRDCVCVAICTNTYYYSPTEKTMYTSEELLENERERKDIKCTTTYRKECFGNGTQLLIKYQECAECTAKALLMKCIEVNNITDYIYKM